MKEREKSDAEQLHSQAIDLFKGVQALENTSEKQSINMSMVKVLESIHSIVIKGITGDIINNQEQ